MFEEKKLFIVVLKMQKNSQNIINLYQVLNIQTLQVMEPKKEKKSIIQFIILPLAIFQRDKIIVLNIIHTFYGYS
jgi:hypothetical protein